MRMNIMRRVVSPATFALLFVIGVAGPSYALLPPNGTVLTFVQGAGGWPFDVGGMVTLPFIARPTTYTISAWIRPTVKYTEIFGWSQFSDPFVGLRVNAGVVAMVDRNVGAVFSNTPLSDCDWANVTVTVDDKIVKFYLNGVPDGGGTQPATTPSYELNTTTIGGLRRFGSGNGVFDGQMGGVTLWDASLDAATILARWNQPVDNTHPFFANLLGDWRMNDGSGTNVADFSTFARNGTLAISAGGTLPTWTAPLPGFCPRTVTYNGNTSDGGAAPVDGSSPYHVGSTVTVMGAETLTKTGYTFASWNTAADGSGTSYAPAATFAITANSTLYAQWTIKTFFTVAGSVTASCPGTSLLGITVDAFEVGEVPVNLVETAVTDALGAYTIADLPAGSSYTITVVTPLGYAADVPEVQVSSGAAPVNFNLQCVAATGTPRGGMGFWKHNVGVATGGKGAAQVSATTLCSYLDLIAAHFNSNAINEVLIYDPPASGLCADKLQVAKLLLDLKGSVGMLARARQMLMSLLLNVACGSIHQTAVISADGATVSQAITYCDNLIDSPTGNHERAKTIADLINNGQQVGAGLIPLGTPQIPYRHAPSTPSMPIEYDLSQNYPNPFDRSTELEFSLPEPSRVSLVVYDLAGRMVRTMADGEWAAGRHSATLDRTGRDGTRLGAGIYFVRMNARALASGRSHSSIKRVLVVK